MESLSPNVFVDDMTQTTEFYKLLGFQITMSVPEEGDFVWVMMKKGDVTFMFQTFESLGEELPQINRQNGGSLLFYIKVKDINTYFENLKDHVTIIKGLEKTFYGATEFSILDNNGYVLTFAEG